MNFHLIHNVIDFWIENTEYFSSKMMSFETFFDWFYYNIVWHHFSKRIEFCDKMTKTNDWENILNVFSSRRSLWPDSVVSSKSAYLEHLLHLCFCQMFSVNKRVDNSTHVIWLSEEHKTTDTALRDRRSLLWIPSVLLIKVTAILRDPNTVWHFMWDQSTGDQTHK